VLQQVFQPKLCVCRVILSAARMDHSKLVKENVALKAQVESLEIRLTAAHDKVASLQQFIEGETKMRRAAEAALDGVTNSLEAALRTAKEQTERVQFWRESAQKWRQELIRKGADDPAKPKPECETAFAALQLVSKWDRNEGFADLRKQRLENLRRINVLKRGEELMMVDVVQAMREDGYDVADGDWKCSLYCFLSKLSSQLRDVYGATSPYVRHSAWEAYPLQMFTLEPYPDSDMDESSDMDD
jgi:hypothetical protein